MYVYADSYFGGCIEPKDGETYTAFMARCVPALQALQPEMSLEDAKALCEGAWADYILCSASQATVTIERQLVTDSYYNESWWTGWKIKEVHSAVTASVTYSSVEKARAGSGDSFRIAKSAEEKQLVFGWANIAKDANGNYPLDWDGDVTAPEQLEAAAYTYVLKYRTSGEKHEENSVVGQLVESVMFTKEKQEALGIPEGLVPEGWWVGFHIPDKDIFAKVKSGEYEMFSVQGKAKRQPTGQ